MVLDSAKSIGLEITTEAGKTYERLFRARLSEYWAVNRLRDPILTSEFWLNLTEDWLENVGLARSLAARLNAVADDICFGAKSACFKLFPDVRPCLDALASRGIRMAVISNWDNSLHRVLDMFGLQERFDHVFASLEEGVEKPDPELFRIALNALGVSPEEVLHVGDNPIDDGEGARSAGVRAVIVDRDQPASLPLRISSLLQIPEALAWTA